MFIIWFYENEQISEKKDQKLIEQKIREKENCPAVIVLQINYVGLFEKHLFFQPTLNNLFLFHLKLYLSTEEGNFDVGIAWF